MIGDREQRTDHPTRVHIDRVVLRNVDLDPHERTALANRIAAQLAHGMRRRGADHGPGATPDIAVEIAQRVQATIDHHPPSPP